MFKDMCLDDLDRAQKAIETYAGMGGGNGKKSITGYKVCQRGYTDINGEHVSKDEIAEAAEANGCAHKSIVNRILQLKWPKRDVLGLKAQQGIKR